MTAGDGGTAVFTAAEPALAAVTCTATDPAGNVYVVGRTESTQFPALQSGLHGIDAYVAIAEAHEDDDDRSTHIRNGLTEYYAEELAGHGYAGSRDELLEVMSIDIELNAQGLEFWLEKRKQ